MKNKDEIADSVDAHSCTSNAELSSDLEYYCSICGKNVSTEVRYNTWKKQQDFANYEREFGE